MLLRVETHHKGGYVDDLLSHAIKQPLALASPNVMYGGILQWETKGRRDIPDVTLADEHTRMMDAFCETKLVDAGLQAALKKVFDLEGEHVIELHAGLVEHSDTNETANQGVALEQALRVFLVESEELTAVRGVLAEAP